MLSHTTPASIKRANAEADRIMADQAKGTGVDRNAPRGNRSEPLAKAHADALNRRKTG